MICAHRLRSHLINGRAAYADAVQIGQLGDSCKLMAADAQGDDSRPPSTSATGLSL
jgi:hypothetical protein